MGQIYLKFDNQLKFKDIVVTLKEPSAEEAGEYYEEYSNNIQEVQQTSIYGVLVPLIAFNDIVIDFNDVTYLNLKSTGAVPEVEFSVKDRYELISTLDTPGSDNALRIQILPPFDDAYKKINLEFYISSINIRNGVISGKGIYKIPKLISSQFKSFGEVSTYELFEEIAKDTSLGFASNVESSTNDKRYVYCDNRSYLDVMRSEILKSASDATHIYDFWVDFWNNINFVDIYERYNSIDKNEDMQVWISGQPNTSQEGIQIEPMQALARFNNLPSGSNSELFVKSHTISNNPRKQATLGTDKIISCYEENKKEYIDFLIMDGDVQQDIFTQHEYVGEIYGDYNYMLAQKCRDSYLQKMSTETVKITLGTPLLGVLRGDKVEFAWFVNNSDLQAQRKGLIGGVNNDPVINDVQTTPIIDDSLSGIDAEKYNDTNGDFILNKSISGQYMVTSQTMKYEAGIWNYEIELVRPAKNKPKMLNEKLKE